jgi:hypothetical protein
MLSRAAVGSRIVGRPYALPYAGFVPKIVNHIAFGLVVEDVAHSLDEARFHALGTKCGWSRAACDVHIAGRWYEDPGHLRA